MALLAEMSDSKDARNSSQLGTVRWKDARIIARNAAPGYRIAAAAVGDNHPELIQACLEAT